MQRIASYDIPVFDQILRSRVVACALGVLAAALSAWYVSRAWIGRMSFDATRPYANPGLSDFRDTAVLPNLAIMAGVNPYDARQYQAFAPGAQEFDPYVPWWLTATRPFAMMSWETATLVWVSICAILYILAAGHLYELLRPNISRPHVALAAFAVLVVAVWAWRPDVIALGLGNVGGVVALSAAFALISPRPWLRVVLLAIAWIKPQYGIPITLLLLCWPGRRWQAALGTALAAIASIPAIVETSRLAGGFGALISSVLRTTGEVGAGFHATTLVGRVDLAGVAGRFGSDAPLLLELVAGLGLTIIVGLTTRRLLRGPRRELAYLLAGCTVLVTLPHFGYDLAMLLPFVATTAVATAAKGMDNMRERGLIAVLGLSTLLLLTPGRAIHAASDIAYTVVMLALIAAGIIWAATSSDDDRRRNQAQSGPH